ncbi:hypothetical protein Pmani_008032 [Petrolisthes manimaculis]|uniref:Uncharacterized protein n=1 Tax=Petrolisthes manimaculis TaxID=1843537 RepID=A0AAE1Q9H4_9EUCA|nr:hypothetical protein Pmani_008032 [Petrolisthes manimaculis]
MDFRTRIHETLQQARENLKVSQARMKQRYDGKARPLSSTVLSDLVKVLQVVQHKDACLMKDSPLLCHQELSSMSNEGNCSCHEVSVVMPSRALHQRSPPRHSKDILRDH